MVADTTRPTEEMVAGGFAGNSDGAGIAWRGEDADGPYIEYHKGIKDIPVIQELVANAPLPFVTHFRIASVGGPLRCLTHPFVIQPNLPGDTILSGRTRQSVLFHNGTWSSWRGVLTDLAVKGCWKIPPGAWSDSRAMAFIAAHIGIGFLEFLAEERILVFDPAENDETDGINFLGNTRWSVVNNVTCSNNFFCYRKASEVDWRKVDQREDKVVVPPVGSWMSQGALPDDEEDETDYDPDNVLPQVSPFRRALLPPEKEDAKRRRIEAALERAAKRDKARFDREGSPEVDPDKIPFPKRRNRRKGHRNAIWRTVKGITEARIWYANGTLSKNQYKHAVLHLGLNWYEEQANLKIEDQKPRPTLH